MPRGEACDAGAQRLDGPRHLRARRMGQRRGHLIRLRSWSVSKKLRPTAATRMTISPSAGSGPGTVFDAMLLRSAELAELRHAHGCFLDLGVNAPAGVQLAPAKTGADLWHTPFTARRPENPRQKSAASRLFRHRRRGRLEGRQSRQSAALGPRLRRKLRLHHRRRSARHETPSPTPRRPRRTFRSIIGKASTSFACRAAAGWSASSFSTRRSICRASPTRCRPPMCSGRSAARSAPSVIARCHHLVRIPTAFSLNVATAGRHRHVRSLALPRPLRRRPIAAGGSLAEPVPSTCKAVRAAEEAELTPSPGQRRIKYVCFPPLTRIGTGKCAKPFELSALSPR